MDGNQLVMMEFHLVPDSETLSDDGRTGLQTVMADWKHVAS